jgi:CRP-like cAMP-binding protein
LNSPARQSEVDQLPGERRFISAGRPVRVPPGFVAIVEQGVVRLEVIHDDGSSAIIGFAGPGEGLVHHVDRFCHVHPVAHDDVMLELVPIAAGDRVQAALAARLHASEAWLSMLARHGVAERLRALRQLLGSTPGLGLPLLKSLTREQLAMATLSSRASIARALRALRDGGG